MPASYDLRPPTRHDLHPHSSPPHTRFPSSSAALERENKTATLGLASRKTTTVYIRLGVDSPYNCFSLLPLSRQVRMEFICLFPTLLSDYMPLERLALQSTRLKWNNLAGGIGGLNLVGLISIARWVLGYVSFGDPGYTSLGSRSFLGSHGWARGFLVSGLFFLGKKAILGCFAVLRCVVCSGVLD